MINYLPGEPKNFSRFLGVLTVAGKMAGKQNQKTSKVKPLSNRDIFLTSLEEMDLSRYEAGSFLFRGLANQVYRETAESAVSEKIVTRRNPANAAANLVDSLKRDPKMASARLVQYKHALLFDLLSYLGREGYSVKGFKFNDNGRLFEAVKFGRPIRTSVPKVTKSLSAEEIFVVDYEALGLGLSELGHLLHLMDEKEWVPKNVEIALKKRFLPKDDPSKKGVPHLDVVLMDLFVFMKEQGYILTEIMRDKNRRIRSVGKVTGRA